VINLFLNSFLVYNPYFDNKLVKYGYNEREQKALSILISNDLNKYNTLLIGSSRTTYFNQTHFKKFKVFNFAVSDMDIKEMPKMIQFARRFMPNLKYIIIGFDFRMSNKNKSINIIEDNIIKSVNIDKYNILFALKRVLSIDSLKYGLKNIILTLKKDYNSYKVYNNHNIALYNESKLQPNLKLGKVLVNYKYNENISEYLYEIKQNSKGLKIFTYITPITSIRFQQYLKIIDKKSIQRFYNDISKISDNKPINFLLDKRLYEKISKYFMYTHHLTPKGCDILIKEIENAISINK